MTIELAVRLTEIIFSIAIIQQSLEHLTRFKGEQILFSIRIFFAVILIFGFKTDWIIYSLFILNIVILYRFDGPYNGGADRMGLLIVFCLSLFYLSPTRYWQELAFGYLAIQLVLSYCISGWVKVVNSEWRSGQALVDVFNFSVYPVSESLRNWSKSPSVLLVMSWVIIIFELLFPLSLFSNITLICALFIAACFHFANACLFGLNRFFWIWIATYPSILWFQYRIS
jgi:hypothetical protein